MVIIVPVPEGRLDIDFLLREKTASEVALGCQSQSIANGTKMVAQGPNEPYLPLAPVQSESFCWTTKTVCLDGSQGP
jgi:hypothetical protein